MTFRHAHIRGRHQVAVLVCHGLAEDKSLVCGCRRRDAFGLPGVTAVGLSDTQACDGMSASPTGTLIQKIQCHPID